VSTPGVRLPILVSFYETYLADQDTAQFLRHVQQYYTQGTLQRLAEHPAPQIRRAAVLALGLLGDYEANATMGRALHDDDRTVRMLAENGIRSVWRRAGTPKQQELLAVIVRLNESRRYQEAAQRASQLIAEAPWLAEAWNQRAIARFGMEDYAGAIEDCHQTLELNPYHFAAATGMGHAYLRLNNPRSALESFRRALKLNPSLEAVRCQVVRLSRLIEGK